MNFTAPLFLAGLALLTAPWLIHRIRKPEREELRFSSLMFIPNIKKEVVERRKLQHILLMLLRMLLLALLALAFSRPFYALREKAGAAPDVSRRHLVLVDVSYSMKERFSEAKRIATRVLNEIPVAEAVGLAEFAGTPRLLLPIAAREQRESVEALAGVRPSLGATDYPTALQFAENLLLAKLDEDEENIRVVVHLISDFQRSGIPEPPTAWRLSGQVELVTHPVARKQGDGLSLTEIAIRPLDEGGFVVAGKVKNWTSADREGVAVALVMGERVIMEKKVAVNAGNASQVLFQLPGSEGPDPAGRLVVGEDDGEDNRRYFAWRRPGELKVMLVADPHDREQYPAAQFVDIAVRANPRWKPERVTQTGMVTRLAANRDLPGLVVAGDLNGFTEETGTALTRYVRAGGRVLVCLNAAMEPGILNRSLLETLGVRDEGLRYGDTRDSRFEILSWIDFRHPVFLPFQGTRFNDFSQLRFFNFHRLAAMGEDTLPAIARFGNGEQGADWPAMLEGQVGEGRIMVWAFAPELGWTNFPKHIKFVPLLHETLTYLGGAERVIRSFLIGERYPVSRLPEGSVLRLPGGEEHPLSRGGDVVLSQTGLLATSDSAGNTLDLHAVNIDPREADPEVMPLDEFVLKLTSPGVAQRGDLRISAQEKSVPDQQKREYGHLFLVFLMMFLLLETLYAVKLSRARVKV